MHYVRNITDIDDKILRRADENGEVYTDLTDRMIHAMHEDEARLGVLAPNDEPRATAYIDDIIAMIQTLISGGHAYAADNGDVYFAVDSFPDYGKLSKKKLEDLLADARVDVQKPSAAGGLRPVESRQAGWMTSRPGVKVARAGASSALPCPPSAWVIPSISTAAARTCCSAPVRCSRGAAAHKFVHTWMHAGAIRVNEKMSKSLGNFFTIPRSWKNTRRKWCATSWC